MAELPKLDLGVIAEGTVELDPMTGRYVVRVVGDDGKNTFIDLQEAVAKYRGQDVRFILTPFSTIDQLAEMVESGEIDANQVPTLKTLS
jgi:hypothetical protein